MSRWLVRITFIVLIIIFAFVGVVSATLFTPIGLQVGVWGAQQALPALSLEHAEGSLLTGFELDGLQYHDDQIQLVANSIELDIKGKCLLTPSICIDKLAAEGVTLALNFPPSDDNTAAEPSTARIQSPLPIHINAFAFNDVAIQVAGQAIDWQQLQGGVHVEGDTLTLSPTEWQQLLVTLPTNDSDQENTDRAVGKPDSDAPSRPFSLLQGSACRLFMCR
jgi:Uncharacterized protein conserved in bacteria